MDTSMHQYAPRIAPSSGKPRATAPLGRDRGPGITAITRFTPSDYWHSPITRRGGDVATAPNRPVPRPAWDNPVTARGPYSSLSFARGIKERGVTVDVTLGLLAPI